MLRCFSIFPSRVVLRLLYRLCPKNCERRARAEVAGSRLATSLFDTFPFTTEAGTQHTVQIALRNDGWETWTGGGSGSFTFKVEATSNGEFQQPTEIALPRAVPPGDSIVLEMPWTAGQPGDYILRYEMADSTGTAFSTGGAAPITFPIEVVTSNSRVADFELY